MKWLARLLPLWSLCLITTGVALHAREIGQEQPKTNETMPAW